MDSETLISEIRRMPALWNKQNKNFSNRVITTKNWQLISKKMGVTTDQCKKKFKYLKDEYRKAQRKVPKHASGPGAAELHISKFKYYNLMKFLYDDAAEVDFQSSHESLVDDCSMSCLDDTAFEKAIMKQEIEITDDELPGSFNKHNTKEQQDVITDPIGIEQKALKLLETDENNIENMDNDDLHFFKSLIPHTKGLSSIEKLRMRGEIQNIVIKYLEIR